MPHEIICGLWIGDKNDAADIEFLKSKRIKVIMNVSQDIMSINVDGIAVYRVPVNDNPSVSSVEDNKQMMNALKKAPDVINSLLNQNKNVLVHCYAGKQRSATIICGYIMKYSRVNMSSAIKYIQSKREICFTPTVNFYNALKAYENMIHK